MAKLTWDNVGEKYYEAGVDRGVLFVDNGPGVAWSGLVNVNQRLTGTTPTSYYLDGVKFDHTIGHEDLELTIDAFTYPDEFISCEGTELTETGLLLGFQERKPFSLVYRTKVGNDTDGIDHGYKLHFVYNCTAYSSGRSGSTITDSPSPLVFSWSALTIPELISGKQATPYLVVDSRYTPSPLLKTIENSIYGTSSANSKLLLPSDLLGIYATISLRIDQNTTSGLSGLIVDATNPDVIGAREDGIYTKAAGSRLSNSSGSGLYTLE